MWSRRMFMGQAAPAPAEEASHGGEAERATVDSLLGFSLLDYLAFRCGCLCLSDLRYVCRQRLAWTLETVPVKAFSRKSWEQALAYLTGETAEDPRPALLRALRS